MADLHLLAPAVAAALEALGPAAEGVEVVACADDEADTADFCRVHGYALEDSANTIVVAGKADPPRHAACVLLATTRLDVNKAVRHRLGTRKASFAPGEESVAVTGQTPGGITPIGLPAGLPLWVDAAVLGRDRIVLGGGNRTSKVLAPPSLLLALGGEVVEGLANPIVG